MELHQRFSESGRSIQRYEIEAQVSEAEDVISLRLMKRQVARAGHSSLINEWESKITAAVNNHTKHTMRLCVRGCEPEINGLCIFRRRLNPCLFVANGLHVAFSTSSARAQISASRRTKVGSQGRRSDTKVSNLPPTWPSSLLASFLLRIDRMLLLLCASERNSKPSVIELPLSSRGTEPEFSFRKRFRKSQSTIRTASNALE